MLVFIAGVAALAIFLARRPTVADGHVMEAELLGLLRAQGVTGVVCDPKIPISHQGAAFACTATLRDGTTQLLDCTMDRDGKLKANPAAPPRRVRQAPSRIPASDDPWANRP